MLLLAASHIKFVYNVYNYSFKKQFFFNAKIIQKHRNTYYSSLLCIQKYFSISITYPIHVH